MSKDAAKIIIVVYFVGIATFIILCMTGVIK